MQALLDKYLDGTLTPDEARALDAWAREDDANARLCARAFLQHYLTRQYMVGTSINRMLTASEHGLDAGAKVDEAEVDSSLLAEALELESAARQAREAEAARQAQMRLPDDGDLDRFDLLRLSDDPVTPVRHIVIPRALVWGVGMLVAALIVLAVYPHVAAPPVTPDPAPPMVHAPAAPVATLVAAVEPVWAEPAGPRVGEALTAGRLTLRSGLAKLRFHNGAEVIVQGPAVFEPLDVDRGRLQAGRLVANCPAGAEGFSILTQSSRIVDLGTEFGVSVEDEHRTQVHVFDGVVIAALNGEGGGESLRITEGQTARVDATAGAIERLADNRVDYARRMVRTLDLTDLVAGGDGRGTTGNRGIDPGSGAIVTPPVPLSNDFDGWNQRSDGRFHPVTASRYLAGVFIPDPRRHAVTIDPTGRTFDQCPATDGLAYGYIWAGRPIPVSSDTPPVEVAVHGKPVDEERIVTLSANAGLTVDLRALTDDADGMAMHRFTATAVNLEATRAFDKGYRGARPKADIWVLVDGQVRFSRTGFNSADGAVEIDVPLHPQDRYLTIITTDGGNTNSFDWVVLLRPGIEMTSHSGNSSMERNVSRSNSLSSGGFDD